MMMPDLIKHLASHRHPRAVPGSAESGDHFGAAVGFLGEHFAAGVPDEDVGASSNAGMVQLFSWSSTAPVPTGEVKQYTPGVPGKVESGDRFGAAVVIGRNIGCFDNSIQGVAGVPGEDTTVSGSARKDAGTVAIFTPPPVRPLCQIGGSGKSALKHAGIG